MAKLKKTGTGTGGGGIVGREMECQDDILDLEAKIGWGRSCSSITLSIESRGPLSEKPHKCEALKLTLSYYQAQAIQEILQNFIISRMAERKALRPTIVTADGEIKGSTFPQRI
jgi:hypothetical protein